MFREKTYEKIEIIRREVENVAQKKNPSYSLPSLKIIDFFKLKYEELEARLENKTIEFKIEFYNKTSAKFKNMKTPLNYIDITLKLIALDEYLYSSFKRTGCNERLHDNLETIDLQFDAMEDLKINHLFFSATKDTAESTFRRLKNNKTIKEIFITDFDEEARLLDIADLLNNNNVINFISMSSLIDVSTEASSKFYDELSNNVNINSLSLGFNRGGDYSTEINILAEVIKNNKSINEVCFVQADYMCSDANIVKIISALKENLYITKFNFEMFYNSDSDEDDEQFDIQMKKIESYCDRNINFVKQVAKFLIQKFVMGEEFSLGEEIKYLKHYQNADKELLKDYIDKEIESGKIDPSKIELVSNTNIQKYIAKNFLKLSMVTKGTNSDELSSEQVSSTDDELSFEQVSSNSKKRKISDETPGPSKVRKLESSSVTSQEEAYLSEEVIAEIASFLGPKNLWHVDTGIVPSIEDSTDELNLVGMGSSIDFETGDISN